MTPARQRIAIDHREFQNRVRLADHLGYVEPVEFPVLEARQEVGELARPIPVLARQHGAVAHVQVADPVDQRLAGLGVPAADRIADELLRVVARLHHGGAAEIRLADGDAAPHQDALPLGRAFVGIEVRAHGGVDAVGADQDVGLRRLDGIAAAVDEAGDDLAALLLEGREAAAEPDLVRAQHLPGRLEQDHLQLAAMDRELRPRQAGVPAARIGPDRLAVAVGIAQLARLDAGGGERRLHAEARQDAHRARLDVDADAKRLELAHRIEDFDVEPCPRETHRGGEAADARAGNDDLHAGLRGPCSGL